MKSEPQAALFWRYPKLFRKPGMRLFIPDTGAAYLVDSAGSIDERGIECGDGWIGIVDRLSCACEREIETMDRQGVPEECWPRVAQIKEKLGAIRFYVFGPLSDAVREQIGLEQSDKGESARTCASCGGPRKPRDGRLLNTDCDACSAIQRAHGPQA